MPVEVELVVDAVISCTAICAVSLALRPVTATVSVLDADPPLPPPQFVVHAFDCTVTGTFAVLFEALLSVVDAFSPTVAVLVIVWPAVPVLTSAAMASVALELALKLPIVHVPVEVAYVPTDAVAFLNVSPEGKVSVATTPVEAAGPRADTVNV